MKKKFLALLLTFFALCLLIACANNSQTDKSTSETKSSSQSKNQAKETNTLEFSTDDLNKVIYDKDGVKISFLGFEEGDYNHTLKFAYENQTDKDYDLQARNGAVNGIDESDDYDFIIYSDSLEANTSSEGGPKISLSALEKADISQLETITFTLKIIYDITETIDEIPLQITVTNQE